MDNTNSPSPAPNPLSWHEPRAKELFANFLPVFTAGSGSATSTSPLSTTAINRAKTKKRLLESSQNLSSLLSGQAPPELAHLSKTLGFSLCLSAFLRASIEALKSGAASYRQSSLFRLMNLEASLFALEALLLDLVEELGLNKTAAGAAGTLVAAKTLNPASSGTSPLSQEFTARLFAAKKCARDSLAEFSALLVFLSAEEMGQESAGTGPNSKPRSSYALALKNISELSALEQELGLDPRQALEKISSYLGL